MFKIWNNIAGQDHLTYTYYKFICIYYTYIRAAYKMTHLYFWLLIGALTTKARYWNINSDEMIPTFVRILWFLKFSVKNIHFSTKL
jgi:hypothetical protein